MERIENPESRPSSPPATQTIVLERRPRGGWLGRLAGTFLLFVFVMYLLRGPLGAESGLPVSLHEEYLAGDLVGPKIAVVEVTGLIFDEEVEFAIKQIRQARDDERVRAVVLRVDSPGGTVSGSDRIWREIALLKAREKPVVASMGGLAASGGYYVSAPADHIFAEPTTMTGSIGVIFEVPVVQGLLEKVGVEFQTIKTGRWKDSPSMFHPMSEEEKDRWSSVIDDAYQRFVRVVAQGRKLPLSDVQPLADGRVFTAEEAKTGKLVDEIGYQDDAILHAQRLAGLSSFRAIRYARSKSLAESLIGLKSPDPGVKIDSDLLLKLQAPKMLYLAR